MRIPVVMFDRVKADGMVETSRQHFPATNCHFDSSWSPTLLDSCGSESLELQHPRCRKACLRSEQPRSAIHFQRRRRRVMVLRRGRRY